MALTKSAKRTPKSARALKKRQEKKNNFKKGSLTFVMNGQTCEGHSYGIFQLDEHLSSKSAKKLYLALSMLSGNTGGNSQN